MLKNENGQLPPWNDKTAEIGSPNTIKRMLQALPPGDIVNAIIGTPENPAPVVQEIALEKLFEFTKRMASTKQAHHGIYNFYVFCYFFYSINSLGSTK